MAWSASLNGNLFFSANDGTRGSELWRTDGTKAGTRLLANLNPGDDDGIEGPDGSQPREFARLGDRIYFAANDGVTGLELWRTNGTRKGTKLVKNIDPGDDDGFAGPDSSAPTDLTKLGDRLYFRASDGIDGAELWRTDGTRKRTQQVKDIFPGSMGSFPIDLLRHGKRIYFRADDGDVGAEVWRSDGTKAGTKLLHNVWPGSTGSSAGEFASLGRKVYFRADDGLNGIELWRTNGKPGGASLVKDINPVASSAVTELVRLGDRLYFGAVDGTRGRELWRTDGRRRGTKLVRDINPGDDDVMPGPDSSNPFYLARLGRRLYFSAEDGLRGRELWRTNGRGGGTKIARNIVPGSDSGLPCELVRLGGRLIFAAIGPGGWELWKTDGSRSGTRLLKDIRPGPISSAPLGCD
jgi:ELWxxDGT repeat protein